MKQGSKTLPSRVDVSLVGPPTMQGEQMPVICTKIKGSRPQERINQQNGQSIIKKRIYNLF